ncbi:MAG: hypothetical protein HY435_02230 [Candidatus Liptonbacteria bacterium]|nr:hypothetical protein [Candidatus Liptonbacteria bacterium]
MTRQCQNCKASFEIGADDLAFYQKISVPPPTFCSKCRLERRLAFVNLFNLYKRPCDLCHTPTFSVYRPDAPYVVYCPKCWWSDDWDPLEYGRDYDFSRPFFEQLNELWHRTPLLGLSIDFVTLATSPYTNHIGHLKNGYLVFHADFNEDIAYGFYLVHSKALIDCSLAMNSELCYDSMHIYKVNRGVGLRSQVTESLDCAFLKDCMNCQNCFASANLRSKKYYIFNKPYTREEYFKKLKTWDLGSYTTYKEVQKAAEEHWKTLPPKPHMDEFAPGCTGRLVFQSKNCKDCFEVVGAEDSRYLLMIEMGPVKDCYDLTSWGNNMELCYECSVVGEGVFRGKFCQESGLSLNDAEYCKLSTGTGYHFGCVSVKKTKYCILNKQYGEEEFHALREKIIEHMNEMPYVSRGANSGSTVLGGSPSKDKEQIVYKYGEFFPIEMSPFAYNETMAARFFTLSKAEAESKGFRWQEPEKSSYAISKAAHDLPDHIKDATDAILKEVIGCEACGRGFKIIKMELDFLRRMNLPLPRWCPFCRINEKFDQWVKNLHVFTRTCAKCGAEFETNYPEEEAEYILCKKCYLEEIV